MENKEYNNLIYNNKFDELANICNISDLTTYKYINKYLLEYLLARNIHTTRMDSYAVNNKLWINLYMNYNITKPLVKASLDILLEKERRKYLLDILLSKMTKEEKRELYKNIKYTWVWLYRNKETEIIEIFKKHGIIISKTFLEMPKIVDNKLKSNKKLDTLLKVFSETFKDIDKNVLKVYIEEIKRYSKVDLHRTYIDVIRLIDYKMSNKNFKLKINDLDIYTGSYNSSDEYIAIDQYIHGLFNHELSHFLFEQYEDEDSLDLYKDYCKIRKEISKKSTVNKIVRYLKGFHEQVKYMKDIFTELYYKEISRQYGSVGDYILKIYLDIMAMKPEKMILDKEITEVYIDYDEVGQSIKELLASECKDYVDICLTNYYSEEYTLENLLDALLRGKINDGNLIDECYSGHTIEYFNGDRFLSLDECLADYDEIKCSKKADIIIDKLIELVGNDLVDLLEKHLHNKRGSKKKSKTKYR